MRASQVKGSLYRRPKAGPKKLCTAASEQVLQKKNAKHTHTEGNRKKAKAETEGAEGGFVIAAGAACTPGTPGPLRGGFRAAERHHSSAATNTAHRPHTTIDQRHEPVAEATPAMTKGAAAQPKLPLMPCTEKACPKRVGDTRWFRMEKSAG